MVEAIGAADRPPRTILEQEPDPMRARVFNWRASFLAFAIATFLASVISSAQNASVGSESGLDRAMQQNVVKNRGIQPEKKGKVNQAEETAYKAFLASQNGDPATRIQLGEDFAGKFPLSNYLPGV
jgi:hypothetical protein